jgi:hypothetical protein
MTAEHRAQRLGRAMQALWVSWEGSPLEFATIVSAYAIKAQRAAALRMRTSLLSEGDRDVEAFDRAVNSHA